MPEQTTQLQFKENTAPTEKANTPAVKQHSRTSRNPFSSCGERISSPADIPLTPHNILFLQRTVGNHTVSRLIQAKLKIGQPGDEYEREADRVAEQVLRMPEPGSIPPNGTIGEQIHPVQREQLYRQPEDEEQRKRAEEENTIQLKPISSSTVSQSQLIDTKRIEHQKQEENKECSLQAKSLNSNKVQPVKNDTNSTPGGTGRPLEKSSKEMLECGFRTNLNNIRIHDDTTAHNFVRSRKAYAVTFGQDIYIGTGVDEQTDGNVSHTLAHEVAHTIQQRSSSAKDQIRDVEQYQNLERQADQAADSFLRDQPANVDPNAINQIEQAQSEESELSYEVKKAKTVVLLFGYMSPTQRDILQTDPPTYREVIKKLIDRDADWLTDKLLEWWIDEDDETVMVATVRKWAMTPKIEGGNYLDEFLDRIRDYSYSFDYLVAESASGNMLDKLYSELDGADYKNLISIVDTFSARYAGYRGRGGITRWSGIGTAVMPSAIKDRLSRLNQRLAGRVTVPMTPEEVKKINSLYAKLRNRTFGLVDMPHIQIGPDEGQQAAQVLAIPAVAVGALVYALIMAVLVTITAALIIEIIIEIERALDRAEQSLETATATTVAVGTTLMAQKVGDQIRGLTGTLVIHLARILGETVSGQPPDHQEDPERDRSHWWKEIKNFLKQIKDKGLTDKQLLRELRKKFTDTQLTQIREALSRVAEMMGEGPPNFPPAF